jgi:hypothetical protein
VRVPTVVGLEKSVEQQFTSGVNTHPWMHRCAVLQPDICENFKPQFVQVQDRITVLKTGAM